jgi:hypothetical protein
MGEATGVLGVVCAAYSHQSGQMNKGRAVVFVKDNSKTVFKGFYLWSQRQGADDW